MFATPVVAKWKGYGVEFTIDLDIMMRRAFSLDALRGMGMFKKLDLDILPSGGTVLYVYIYILTDEFYTSFQITGIGVEA